VDDAAITRAFDDVFDQALLFHGFAKHMRDYDVYIYATADPATGITPDHLRYRFTKCVACTATTTVRDDVWPRSLDDRLIDYNSAIEAELDGYVWGVNWQMLYPGMTLVQASAEADAWSSRLSMPFREAVIEGNGHRLALVFVDLEVEVLQAGAAPFVVPDENVGPDGKYPLT
jgi:hypothetical protein